ncbi:transposase [Desulfococcus sp.]|uniref:transposase n=1 Tax=Desulfococcus sp. TaxID=2025834 RepID=UPI003593D9F5
MTGDARYNPAIHHRRSIRLQGYDYSQAGAYFITICTHIRECLFGEIKDREMQTNDAGKMVHTVWNDIPFRFDGLELDIFIVMPSHIHGIIVLPWRRGESCIRPSPTTDHSTDHKEGDHKDRPYGTLPGTVGRIVQAFKSISTRGYTVGVKKSGWSPFQGKLWQRNYWEHIIRNETELNRTRAYIQDNPDQWESDKLHPRGGERFSALMEIREPAA